FADLGHLRVRDRVDHRTSGLGGRSVGGADEDGAVVFDADLRARVLLDLVDHLALRSDDLTDLVDGDVHGDDPRCGRGHLGGGVDGFGDDVEDDHAGLTGLLECRGQHRGGQSVELGVELDGSYELAGSGDLEVHVAEGVLGTEDVRQSRIGGLLTLIGGDDVGDQTHGDAGDGCGQRHTGREHGQG